jgi:hypothetical protein
MAASAPSLIVRRTSTDAVEHTALELKNRPGWVRHCRLTSVVAQPQRSPPVKATTSLACSLRCQRGRTFRDVRSMPAVSELATANRTGVACNNSRVPQFINENIVLVRPSSSGGYTDPNSVPGS